MQSLFAVSESISTMAAPPKPRKRCRTFYFFEKNKKLATFAGFSVALMHIKSYDIRNFMIRIVGVKEPPVLAAPLI